MLNFYLLPLVWQVGISVFVLLAVVLQAIALTYCCIRSISQKAWMLENLFEFAVLLHMLLFVLLTARIRYNWENGFIMSTNGGWLRWGTFAMLAVLGIIISIHLRHVWTFLTIGVFSLLLPVTEAYAGQWFPMVFLFCFVFFAVRSIHIILLRHRELQESLSTLSIKEAIDVLHTGVLFASAKGNVLLMNHQMQNLMCILTGDVRRNCQAFYRMLEQEQCCGSCKRLSLSGELAYALPDHTVWRFTMQELSDKKQRYFQLTAADITEQWNLICCLQKQQTALEQRQEQLKDTLEQVQELAKQEARLRMKQRLHDVLGQRIALLLHRLRSEVPPEPADLSSLVEGLLSELTEETMEESPEKQLQSLQQTMSEIGVIVTVNGALPENQKVAALLVEILYEAITNAIRHGLAKHITVQMGYDEVNFSMTVENDGIQLSKEIREGNGLTAIRRKLAPYRGKLTLETKMGFRFLVSIPKGEIV
ncbi:MAG: sensor histidine kinase [Ruminococcus sp.]